MIIIAASSNINIDAFISLINQSNCNFHVDSFKNWQKNKNVIKPEGFVYIRVALEVTTKRALQKNTHLSIQDYSKIKNRHAANESLFIKKIDSPHYLHNNPILVLNGTIDFEKDFSQFYTHLFSIKKFFQEITDEKAKKNGSYIPPKKHSGCSC